MAADMVQSRDSVLHIFLSGAHAGLGKFETGDKCLQEHQLVAGADCRQKEQE